MTQQTRPTSWRRMLAVAATVLAFTLSGCTSPAPISGSAAPVSGSDSPIPTSAGRQQYADSVTTTVTCDDGEYTFNGFSGVYEITNDCQSISVSGSSVVILAQNIGHVEVLGFSNRVYALSVSEVDVSGSSNLVTWETGSPTVTDNGFQNTIVRGK